MSKQFSRELRGPKTGSDPIAEARRQWERHGWQEAAPGMAAVTSLVRVNQILLGLIEDRLRPLGLTFARFEILRLLGFTRSGRMPMGKIGNRLQVHPASVTSAVKRLERDGLLRRTPDEEDSRVVFAELLDDGVSRLAVATEEVNEVFHSIPLGGDEVNELLRLMNQIRATAGDRVEDPR